MNMHHPPTSSELLDLALSHQAPHLVERVAVLLGGDVTAQLAHAIDRRAYIAKKDRDREMTGVLDEGAELLDKALAQQASRVVQLLSEALPANRTGLLRELASAIGDRVDAATRQHDEEIARHLDEAADRIRSRYDHAHQVSETLDHSVAELAAAAVDEELTAELEAPPGKACAGCKAPLAASDPDVCELCDMHGAAVSTGAEYPTVLRGHVSDEVDDRPSADEQWAESRG